jgi:hypothetical protein
MKVRNSEIFNLYIDLNNVDVLKLQLGWTGYTRITYKTKDERIPR